MHGNFACSSYKHARFHKKTRNESKKHACTALASVKFKSSCTVYRFPPKPALRAQWNKQVQRTQADLKDATKYSVFYSKHFTNKFFEGDSFIAAQFGLTKRKRLKPDAVPSIFHRTTAAKETL